jgi:hypothetical protein
VDFVGGGGTAVEVRVALWWWGGGVGCWQPSLQEVTVRVLVV